MLEEEEEQDKQEPHDEKAEVVADTDLLAKWCNLEAFQDYSDGLYAWPNCTSQHFAHRLIQFAVLIQNSRQQWLFPCLFHGV